MSSEQPDRTQCSSKLARLYCQPPRLRDLGYFQQPALLPSHIPLTS